MAFRYAPGRVCRLRLWCQFLHNCEAGAAILHFQQEVIFIVVKEIHHCIADFPPGDFAFGVVFASPPQIGPWVNIIECQVTTLPHKGIIQLYQARYVSGIMQAIDIEQMDTFAQDWRMRQNGFDIRIIGLDEGPGSGDDGVGAISDIERNQLAACLLASMRKHAA